MVAAGLEPAKPKPLIYSQFPLPLGYATEDGVRVSHCKPNIVRLSIMCRHPVGAMTAETMSDVPTSRRALDGIRTRSTSLEDWDADH